MTVNDLLIGPLVALVILLIAYILRPFVTDKWSYPYYYPALILKMFSAIALGLLYQFYYGGGDTFTYFTHGASHIYEAFYNNPQVGIKLIFGSSDYQDGTWEYASKIWTYRDSSSYLVVRIAGFIALFTGGTYSGVALVFSAISFSGMWALFRALLKLYPEQNFGLAIATLFIPSVLFWGSGILKDTLTIGMLGWATAALIHLLYFDRSWGWWAVLIGSLTVIFFIKRYIVLSFVPAAIVWAFIVRMKKINNQMAQWLAAPVLGIITIYFAYQAILWVGMNDRRYSIDRIAETAKITAYDVGRWTGRNAGSRYDLGDLDGTIPGMLRLAPSAINVSLFRPYLWEINNPLMLIASLESSILLILTMIVLMRAVRVLPRLANSPMVLFAFTFSMIFAFAVGISTYNFGTLFRYKIPLMPFYGILLVIAWAEASALIKQRSQRQAT